MTDARLLVLYDGTAVREGLQTGWGFAGLVELAGYRMLFDTGAKSEVLAHNMRELGVDPADLDALFLSHAHWDHVGGVDAVLGRREKLGRRAELEVHVLTAFPDEIKRQLAERGARVRIHGPLMDDDVSAEMMRIGPGLYTTGQLESSPPEQGLVVRVEDGVSLITGCGHPLVNRMAAAVARRFEAPVRLVAGGFHLFRSEDAQARAVFRGLERVGVERIAPLHCTGERALPIGEGIFGDRQLAGGAGSTFGL
mgnify:CR=1 FL=1